MQITKYTIVVIDTSPDYFIVKCGGCKGTGCSVCSYVGSCKLTVPEGWKGQDVGVVKCGGCNGEGCSACNYVGAYVGRYPRVTCGRCGGKGCGACSYRGSVWEHSLG